MGKKGILVKVVATMRSPGAPQKTFRLDLSTLKWHAHGSESIARPDPAVLDLLEIARVVHEFDRRQPKRTTSVRPQRITVTMPLRAPGKWSSAAIADLCDLLRIQGNAEWTFDFSKRPSGNSGADLVFGSPPKDKDPALRKGRSSSLAAVQTVALFSGGLDSTSGLVTLAGQADKTLLMGYYAQNRAKQARIAEKLGFKRFAQIKSEWSATNSTRRSGGQFLYRSFLFLSLGAVLAQATGASRLLQFENGPLALSVPPLPIYRMTRHAHPLVHLHFSGLFKELTGRSLVLANPFLTKTKGEAVALLRGHLSTSDFKEVVGDTESCWYLNSRTIVAGSARKKNGQPCGACVPCLVRRAALGTDDTKAGVDFRNGKGRAERDPVVRVHYEAYSDFAKRLLDKSYSPREFMEDVPPATRAACSTAALIAPEAAFELYRRFAREWVRTFS